MNRRRAPLPILPLPSLPVPALPMPALPMLVLLVPVLLVPGGCTDALMARNLPPQQDSYPARRRMAGDGSGPYRPVPPAAGQPGCGMGGGIAHGALAPGGGHATPSPAARSGGHANGGKRVHSLPFPAAAPGRIPPLALLALCAGLALPLAACTGRIGEDACFSCAAEKKAASTDTAQATPTTLPVGQGTGDQPGSSRPASQARGPGVATAPGL
ncbi:hypothetical protein RAA17_13990 [Komagataeibacter rhaeticus]|nr:hypothetical protein [Komagataeibacter rhaeticus]